MPRGLGNSVCAASFAPSVSRIPGKEGGGLDIEDLGLRD